MPSKYPIVKCKDLIRVLNEMGFEFRTQKGSHRKYVKQNKIVIVPLHDEIAKGTLKSILQQADVELEEFLKYL